MKEKPKEMLGEGFTERLPEETSFKMIFVEGGTIMMGSESGEGLVREGPVHEVELDSFYIGKYPVTQALWKAVMGEGNNPSYYKGNSRPIEMVSWGDAQSFIQKLNTVTGKAYRLPTEAEWEYAARGGQKSEGYKYAGSNKLKEVGWYSENSHGETKVVGLKHPNELGIYDMSGNVREWCQDWFSEGYYEECHKKSKVKNPQGPAEGISRVLRGGSWFNEPRSCRCAYRYYDFPQSRARTYGFRLVLPVQFQ